MSSVVASATAAATSAATSAAATESSADAPASYKVIGVVLAIVSGLLIGASFVSPTTVSVMLKSNAGNLKVRFRFMTRDIRSSRKRA